MQGKISKNLSTRFMSLSKILFIILTLSIFRYYMDRSKCLPLRYKIQITAPKNLMEELKPIDACSDIISHYDSTRSITQEKLIGIALPWKQCFNSCNNDNAKNGMEFFFYLGFLSQTFTIHRTAGKVGEAISLSPIYHFHPARH